MVDATETREKILIFFQNYFIGAKFYKKAPYRALIILKIGIQSCVMAQNDRFHVVFDEKTETTNNLYKKWLNLGPKW